MSEQQLQAPHTKRPEDKSKLRGAAATEAALKAFHEEGSLGAAYEADWQNLAKLQKAAGDVERAEAA